MKATGFMITLFSIGLILLGAMAVRGDSETAYCVDMCNADYYTCIDSLKKGDADRMTGKTPAECEAIRKDCIKKCEE